MKLYNGDCLDVLKGVNDNSVDAIITDPPYGCNATMKGDYVDDEQYIKEFIPLWLKEFKRVLKDGSYIYLYVPSLYIDNWVTPFKKEFKFLNILAAENMKVGRQYKDRFRNNCQLILVGGKGTPRGFNKVEWIKTSESWLKDKRNPNPTPFTATYPSYIPNYYKATVMKSVGHPDEKNVKLIENFVKISTNENDIVLDPFMGSGSVGVAAVKNKRRFIGIELNEAYYSLAKERIENETLQYPQK